MVDELRQAARAVAEGGIIAYPTEYVWGLGCDPANEAAVMRLLAIKQRPREKGLILVAAEFAQLQAWVDIAWGALAEAVRSSWPGPHTWLLPATARAPVWITGGRDSLAVRISAHAAVRALCEACDGPLVSTSANRSGQPPATDRETVLRSLGAELDLITHGDVTAAGKPTPIRNALTNELVRA